jgi:hypothetical protein
MTEFEGLVLADLSVLKNQMDQLMGVGQPGRLHQMDRRLTQTERSVQRTKGAVGAFGLLLTLVHVALGFLGIKHS